MGFLAGWIPCPITLFVMTFAIVRGVPEPGLIFAATMMAGVAVTMSLVAFAAILFRTQLSALFARRPKLLERAGRVLEGLSGTLLVAVAIHQLIASA